MILLGLVEEEQQQKWIFMGEEGGVVLGGGGGLPECDGYYWKVRQILVLTCFISNSRIRTGLLASWHGMADMASSRHWWSSPSDRNASYIRRSFLSLSWFKNVKYRPPGQYKLERRFGIVL